MRSSLISSHHVEDQTALVELTVDNAAYSWSYWNIGKALLQRTKGYEEKN